MADPVKGSARQRWSSRRRRLTACWPHSIPIAIRRPAGISISGVISYASSNGGAVRRRMNTPTRPSTVALRRSAKEKKSRDLASYSIGVARMLILEMGRDRARNTLSLEEAPEPRVLPPEPEEGNEVRVECLRGCLGQLSPETQDLILRYYRGEKGEKIKNRKGLTQLFGIPANVLRMRALRVRERLQLCVQTCMQGQKKEFVTISGNPAV